MLNTKLASVFWQRHGPIALILFFGFQTVAMVGITLVLSLRNGQRNVNELAIKLCKEASRQLVVRLENYLIEPYQVHQLNQGNSFDIENLSQSSTIRQQFWNQLQAFPQVSEIYGANANGDYLLVGRQSADLMTLEMGGGPEWNYRTYQLQGKGDRLTLLSSKPGYDPRQRPWYQNTLGADRPTWSPVFTLFEEPSLSTALTYPVLDAAGQPQGVLAVGIVLSHVSEMLGQVEVFESGKSFIIERSGLLVATSTQEPLFVRRGDRMVRLSADQSQTAVIQASAHQLQQRYGNLVAISSPQQLSFRVQNERHLLHVTPLADDLGLDWLLVMVVPEAEFTTQIASNNQVVLALCIITVIGGLLLGTLVVSALVWTLQRANLEQQVQEQTAQLQQSLAFEALLKRMTERVRDSLDEQQILKAAVEELAVGLDLKSCDAALYDLGTRQSHISYEFIQTDVLPSQGVQVAMDAKPHLYEHLLRGESLQFCLAHLAPQDSCCLSHKAKLTVLACPMMEHREAIGDLWLFKAQEQTFSPMEVRLAQQVANQCAIALRQSKLYQAAQSQVTELAQLNDLKDDFLSTVSHELRSPMANIRMAIQMLDIYLTPLNLPKAEGYHRYFHILQNECEREINLINDLLDLARLDSGTVTLDWATIDLYPYLTALLEPFQQRVQEHQQQLHLQVAAPLPPLTTDPSYLGRVLRELLHNACKYTPAGEAILVLATEVPQAEQSQGDEPTADPGCAAIQIRVTNTGVEIPEQERDRIFEKFYRIPHNDPWKHGGTGLGLALIKRLVERLNGRIDLDPQPHQTTFVLTFDVLSNTMSS